MPCPTLIIIGAASSIGREVARLGIAYGAEVHGVSGEGRPDLDEPWVEGVAWISTAEWMDQVPRGAVVVAEPHDTSAILSRAEQFERLVIVTSGESLAGLAAAGPNVVVAVPQEVDDSADPNATIAAVGAIRVEQLGMALLRAALDDGIAAHLDHAALLHLGDSVMLQ